VCTAQAARWRGQPASTSQKMCSRTQPPTWKQPQLLVQEQKQQQWQQKQGEQRQRQVQYNNLSEQRGSGTALAHVDLERINFWALHTGSSMLHSASQLSPLNKASRT
jgi:hypothetical protein